MTYIKVTKQGIKKCHKKVQPIEKMYTFASF